MKQVTCRFGAQKFEQTGRCIALNVSNVHMATQCVRKISQNLPPDSSQSLVDITRQNIVSGQRLALQIRPTFC